MFTINFKREFVRCCCCLKTSWKRHKLQRLTGKFQTSTGVQRGPLSHTASNNSCRSLPGTNVVKFFDDAAICGNGGSPVLSRDLLKPKLDTGSRRANVNNFMKVNLPALEKTVTMDKHSMLMWCYLLINTIKYVLHGKLAVFMQNTNKDKNIIKRTNCFEWLLWL